MGVISRRGRVITSESPPPEAAPTPAPAPLSPAQASQSSGSSALTPVPESSPVQPMKKLSPEGEDLIIASSPIKVRTAKKSERKDMPREDHETKSGEPVKGKRGDGKTGGQPAKGDKQGRGRKTAVERAGEEAEEVMEATAPLAPPAPAAPKITLRLSNGQGKGKGRSEGNDKEKEEQKQGVKKRKSASIDEQAGEKDSLRSVTPEAQNKGESSTAAKIKLKAPPAASTPADDGQARNKKKKKDHPRGQPLGKQEVVTESLIVSNVEMQDEEGHGSGKGKGKGKEKAKEKKRISEVPPSKSPLPVPESAPTPTPTPEDRMGKSARPCGRPDIETTEATEATEARGTIVAANVSPTKRPRDLPKIGKTKAAGAGSSDTPGDKERKKASQHPHPPPHPHPSKPRPSDVRPEKEKDKDKDKSATPLAPLGGKKPNQQIKKKVPPHGTGAAGGSGSGGATAPGTPAAAGAPGMPGAMSGLLASTLAALSGSGESAKKDEGRKEKKESQKPRANAGWTDEWVMTPEQEREYEASRPQREAEAAERAKWRLNPINLQEAKDAYRLDSIQPRAFDIPYAHSIFTRGVLGPMIQQIREGRVGQPLTTSSTRPIHESSHART